MKFLFSKEFWHRKRTERELEKYNEPEPPFFILMFFSSAIASIGLVLDSVAIIIGSMMIAPIITPIFGFSLNFMNFNMKDTMKALTIIITGTVVGLVSAWCIGEIVQLTQTTNILTPTTEIISRIQPNLLHMMVAIFSGMVGAYAYSKPELEERIVGIAISVALIPPLATIGLGFAMNSPQVWRGSILLYSTNLAGIAFGSIIMFLMLGFGKTQEEETLEV